MNSVNLVGTLGVISGLAVASSGRPVLRLRLATDDGFIASSGERQARTNWHTVKVFDRAAEALARTLAVGALLEVQGKLTSWESDGRDGKVERVEVEAFRVRQLLPLGRSGAGEENRHDRE